GHAETVTAFTNSILNSNALDEPQKLELLADVITSLITAG
ncbi:MAG: hypothetical protein QG673_518, partial [Pseudomonadota bacterium]|nr:hypothetical protein [Pseudomonadota bacterium]